MIRARPILAALVAASFAVGASGIASAQDLRMALSSEPSAMDPHFHNLGPNNALTSHVFDRLVHFDPKHKPMPGLATSWKTVDDPPFAVASEADATDVTPAPDPTAGWFSRRTASSRG